MVGDKFVQNFVSLALMIHEQFAILKCKFQLNYCTCFEIFAYGASRTFDMHVL